MTSSSFPALSVIGLMSGTSVDSIDALCVRIAMVTDPLRLTEYEVLGTHTEPIPATLREELLGLMASPQTTLSQICQLNVTLGSAFAEAASNLKDQIEAQGHSVDCIASHGQTLWHIPPESGRSGSTMQLGEPSMIAERTGLEVIADFRPGDMAAGGHGAPLVPFADLLLFQHDTQARAVQNIGGIANLTALPAVSDSSAKPMAFDTGPGNMIIDALTELCFDKPYDEGGQIAASGHIHEGMVDAILSHPYFQEPPPKSTGRELFGKPFAKGLLETWEKSVSPADMVATVTYATAQSIADAYRRFVLPVIPVEEVIVGGGGVFNPVLMQQLAEQLSSIGIQTHRLEDYGVDSKFKEALAFAMLGYTRKMGIPNNVPACTGARHPVVMGGSWLSGRQ